jgi:uncharacterized protein (TIGR02217 family)
MSITVFSDVVLSNQVIAQGIKGRQIRKNQRVRTANGFESINIVWDRTMREYDLGLGPVRRTYWQELEALFELTEGGAYGFMLQDPKDFSAGDWGRVALVPGETDVYQLYKRYSFTAARSKDRKITRPLTDTVVVLVSGVPTTVIWDANVGQFTLASAPNVSDVRWTGQFYTPVHFMNDQIDWQMDVAGADPEGRFYSGSLVTLQEILE